MSIPEELFKGLLQENECQGHYCNCIKCEERRARAREDRTRLSIERFLLEAVGIEPKLGDSK